MAAVLPDAALIVRAPWDGLLVDGFKTWEVRGKPANKIGRIAIAWAASGCLVGTVDIQGCIEITRDDLCHPTNVEKHMIKELQQFQQLDKYKRVFAWKIGNGCRFKEPIPYKHNKGAVSWVRLKEMKKTRINTRWQLYHDFRHQMSK